MNFAFSFQLSIGFLIFYYFAIDAWKTLYLHLENAARDFELQAAICSEALLKILPKDHGIRTFTDIVLLASFETCFSYQ